MSVRPCVWVTRARPGAEATARRLRALGYRPLVSPVLQVRPLETLINMDGAAALAFTSANAVRAFADLEADRGLPVFAVGEATAAAARAAGFAQVETAAGDVRALAALIATRAPGLVLNPTAAEPSADLAFLSDAVPVKSVAVYETVAAEPAEALATLSAVDAVLVHSPRAALRLCELIAPAVLTRLEIAAISPAAAAPMLAAGAGRLRAAEFPTEAALLKLLGL